MKLADDPNTLRIKDDATADELRAEIMEKDCLHLPRE
jgi:hypothetical protein